jgi:hypothetical protein
MPLAKNPFVDDPDNVEVFELGYLAGLQDPDSDRLLPLSPNRLDVFNQGVKAGHADTPRPGSDNISKNWVKRSDLKPSERILGLIKHLSIEAIFGFRLTCSSCMRSG